LAAAMHEAVAISTEEAIRRLISDPLICASVALRRRRAAMKPNAWIQR